MRWSRAFLPVLKESPSDAQIVSHKLMLRAGLVRQTAAGIYAWLPLGFRVLKKIEQIVREEQDRAGALEMLMPTIQSAELWRESGRYDAYGPEMLRIRDRHEREMLYGPTNEEMLTAIVRDEVKSYRDLPRTLYHIQWKFRDEVRPRFGVMRGREFLMKDAYSFDLDEAGARQSYYTQMLAYLRTFQRMGIQAVPMKAASGPIGGDLSHEFIVLAPTGESEVFYDAAYEEFDWQQSDLDYGDEAGLQGLFDQVNATYAATDETHDEARWAEVPEDQPPHRPRHRGRPHLLFRRQIFGGDGAQGLRPGRQLVTPMMGSYGVGVSRLVGAIIEASHDDAGIIWPEAVAPWQVGHRDHARRRRAERRRGRRPLREAAGRRRRDALRRPRRAGRGQVRLDGPDRPALAGDHRPARDRRRHRRAQEPRTGEREELSAECALARLTA